MLVDGVDHAAREAERKWGVERLRLLVGPDLRERFDRQRAKFNHAVWNDPLPDVEAHAAAMVRAWGALDQAATAAGAKPLEPVVWEARLASGRVAAIVRSGAEAHHVARDGRYVEVWTLEELARVIDAFPEIGKAKEVFPGALVQRAGPPAQPYDWSAGDEIGI